MGGPPSGSGTVVPDQQRNLIQFDRFQALFPRSPRFVVALLNYWMQTAQGERVMCAWFKTFRRRGVHGYEG